MPRIYPIEIYLSTILILYALNNYKISVLFFQLLLHDPTDVPIVNERGTAISPGLYSFISVESTKVCHYLNINHMTNTVMERSIYV